ncbi:MAG: hypothetical protein KGH94_02345 [Candidatus Micrarchaeota archaeon]|nr:hypothetical protein [Candidatus Micrarchaeota archaeon]
MASDSDLLIFKMRGVEQVEKKEEDQPQAASQPAAAEERPRRMERELRPVTPRPLPPKSTGAPEPSSIYYREEGDYPDPIKFYKEAIAQNASSQTAPLQEAPRSKAESREKAKGMFCSVHQFRHAYAICAYCHRPFCYEDLVDYQKDYYCVQDVDRVTSRYTERLANEYSISNLMASFILIGGFLLYLYYSNGMLGYVISYVAQNPLVVIHGVSLGLGLVIGTLMIMLFSLIGALYILVGSTRARIAVAALSAAAVAVMLFTYQYISSGAIYLLIIAAFEFAAFLAIIHSAASGALSEYNQAPERGTDYKIAYGFNARF